MTITDFYVNEMFRFCPTFLSLPFKKKGRVSYPPDPAPVRKWLKERRRA